MVRKNSRRIVCDICGAVYWAIRRKACPECRIINKKIRSRDKFSSKNIYKGTKIFRGEDKPVLGDTFNSRRLSIKWHYNDFDESNYKNVNRGIRRYSLLNGSFKISRPRDKSIDGYRANIDILSREPFSPVSWLIPGNKIVDSYPSDKQPNEDKSKFRQKDGKEELAIGKDKWIEVPWAYPWESEPADWDVNTKNWVDKAKWNTNRVSADPHFNCYVSDKVKIPESEQNLRDARQRLAEAAESGDLIVNTRQERMENQKTLRAEKVLKSDIDYEPFTEIIEGLEYVSDLEVYTDFEWGNRKARYSIEYSPFYDGLKNRIKGTS